MPPWFVTCTVIAITALCAPLPAGAQAQPTTSRTGWPCGGRVDPAYIRTAEATGGRVLLFAPSEVAGFADETKAASGHDETVLRVGGNLTEAARDVELAIDSSIESVYLFVSVQCLQNVAVIPPPGAAFNTTAPGVEVHEFTAIRLITIKAPSPGLWRIGLAGRGVYSLIVKAKTSVTFSEPALSRDGNRIAGLTPLGERVRLETTVAGGPPDVSFRFIAMNGNVLGSFAPAVTQTDNTSTTYAADVTLPSSEFRVLVTGVDAKGFPFQRVSPRLFSGP